MTDKEKAIIDDGLFSVAPISGLELKNQKPHAIKPSESKGFKIKWMLSSHKTGPTI